MNGNLNFTRMQHVGNIQLSIWVGRQKTITSSIRITIVLILLKRDEKQEKYKQVSET